MSWVTPGTHLEKAVFVRNYVAHAEQHATTPDIHGAQPKAENDDQRKVVGKDAVGHDSCTLLRYVKRVPCSHESLGILLKGHHHLREEVSVGVNVIIQCKAVLASRWNSPQASAQAAQLEEFKPTIARSTHAECAQSKFRRVSRLLSAKTGLRASKP
jgi:hypothetical protein